MKSLIALLLGVLSGTLIALVIASEIRAGQEDSPGCSHCAGVFRWNIVPSPAWFKDGGS